MDAPVRKTSTEAYGPVRTGDAKRLRRVGQGLRAAAPVALSAVPFGLAFGAIGAGVLAPWQVSLMSAVLFSGTAQFVSVSMLGQGAAALPVFITCVVINARHLLMSAAITPHLRSARRGWHLILAHLLTDESFAVSMAAFEGGTGDPWFYLGAGLSMFVLWQIATLGGLVFGQAIPAGLGLEFAMSASLVGLLFLLVRERRQMVAAVASAILCIALRPLLTDTWSTMTATILVASAMVVARGRR